jgi:hypothetical protein
LEPTPPPLRACTVQEGAAGSPLERRRSTVDGRRSAVECRLRGRNVAVVSSQHIASARLGAQSGPIQRRRQPRRRRLVCRPCSPCSPCSRRVRSRRRNGNETSGSAQGTSARPWLGRSLQPSISETRPSTQRKRGALCTLAALLPCPEPASAEVPTVGTTRIVIVAVIAIVVVIAMVVVMVMVVACPGRPCPSAIAMPGSQHHHHHRCACTKRQPNGRHKPPTPQPILWTTVCQITQR